MWLFHERLCCLKLHGFSSESVDSKVSLTRELGFVTSGYSMGRNIPVMLAEGLCLVPLCIRTSFDRGMRA